MSSVKVSKQILPTSVLYIGGMTVIGTGESLNEDPSKKKTPGGVFMALIKKNPK